jgi:hypothetical protein
MSKLTDNDRRFGPLTIGRTEHLNMYMLIVGNYRDDEDRYKTALTVYIKNTCMRLKLPNLISPYFEWRKCKEDGYFHFEPREYGISYHNSHVSILYGRQNMDSSTDQVFGFFIPLTQWRVVSKTMYDIECKEFYKHDAIKNSWEEYYKKQEQCPRRHFKFKDFDGEEIIASTYIEQTLLRKGERWYRWIGYIMKPRIRRFLDIHFSSEVGKEKWSWKGGTVGHSIDILPEECHEEAFKRYCTNHNMTFVGEVKCCAKCGEKLTGHEDENGTHCRWCETCIPDRSNDDICCAAGV